MVKKFRYKYNPSKANIAIGIIFYFVMFPWLVSEVLVISRYDIVYQIAIVIGLLFCVLSVVVLGSSIYRSRILIQYVIIEENRISSPKNIVSNKIISINFNEVEEFYIESLVNQRSIVLISGSEKLIISEILLDGRKVFDELAMLIDSKINKGESGVPPQEPDDQ